MFKKRYFYGFLAFLSALCFLTTTVFAQSHNCFWWNPSTQSQVTTMDVSPGGNIQLRLRAEVPAGETVKAFNFEITYDPLLVTLTSVTRLLFPTISTDPTPPDSPVNTNTPGEIIVNGFEADPGLVGPASVDVVEVVFTANGPVTASADGLVYTGSNSFVLGIQPNSFGSSSTNNIPPNPQPATIKINDCVPSTEVCDGEDNDCDGQVDEDLVRTCYSGAVGDRRRG